MTKRELEAEVERLRDEVATLRAQKIAHVCVPPQVPAVPPPPAQCTCGTSLRCQQHFPSGWDHSIWVTAYPAIGCAAGVPQVYTFNVPA
jgi:hypothetical protein